MCRARPVPCRQHLICPPSHSAVDIGSVFHVRKWSLREAQQLVTQLDCDCITHIPFFLNKMSENSGSQLGRAPPGVRPLPGVILALCVTSLLPRTVSLGPGAAPGGSGPLAVTETRILQLPAAPLGASTSVFLSHLTGLQSSLLG